MMIMKVVMVLLVITHPIYYHNQMKRMISIYDYSISMMVMITDDDRDNCR
jgi:hypothetical protein